MSFSQSKKITEDANEKLMAAMAGLFHSMKEIKGAVRSLGSKMGMNVKHLEDKMNEEWQQMRKGNQALNAQGVPE